MRRPLVLGTVVWCLVVAVGAAVVWQAIDAAGRDIFADTSGVTPASPTPSTEPRPSGHGTTPSPGGGTGSPTGSPSDPGTPRPTDTESAQPSGAEPETRSWQGHVGVVVVTCTGGTASLESATPADGYSVEVDKRGPEEVRVELGGGDDEVRVRARCPGGVPRFEVDDSSGSGS